ncbi:MAG: MATE family efflux transporter [Oscillospiraceae bacterium]|jgi:multidrug efflux pump|nr:MATE family efflux transporter [Oscillospiraceae bacterium]
MEDKNLELLEQASVPKAILKLSLPTVLSTVVSLLYNLTDTYFIGLLDDPVQLGAISLAFPVFLVIQAIGNVFGNGAPSYISRCLGARRMEEVKRAGCVSVYIAVLATLGMTLLYFCFQQPVLRLLGTSPDTIGPTGEYLGIVVGFSAVMTMQVILSALLRAESRIKEAAAGVIIGTILNVVFDPVFIFVFRLGVAGAAWATIIGNACAAGYYLIVYQKRGTALSLAPQDFRPSRRILGEVLKIGLPASAAQILMSFCTVLVNNLAAGYGDYVISAYGVAGKLSNMVYMLVLGYVSGYMPFAGYHYGAGNWERMLEAFRFTWITATGGSLVLLAPYLLLARPFMEAFTSVEEIIQVGMVFLFAQAWSVPLLGTQFIVMCTFQATGSAGRAMIVNLGRQSVFYIPLIFWFRSLWGLTGLIYSYMAADVVTTVAAVALAIPLLRRLRGEGKQRA